MGATFLIKFASNIFTYEHDFFSNEYCIFFQTLLYNNEVVIDFDFF